jgi:uncharacterized protein (DUF58 family)
MTSSLDHAAPPASSLPIRSPALWSGPGAKRRARGRRTHRWRRALWSLLYPQRRQRVLPTVTGTLLIALTGSLGVAAYNTASNILFITLSLLLSGLVLSGVLSWLNLRRVAWRLDLAPPFRVNQTATAAVLVRNDKRLLPTYALWFEVRSPSVPPGTQVRLAERLDPRGTEARLEWSFRPARRGVEVIELHGIGSFFPFGFLRKVLHDDLRQEVVVWPAPVEYERFPVAAPERPLSGEQVARMGHNGDLLALRRYAAGDSHRLIHWKASARLRTLMVRQFATETQEGLSLWLETDAGLWPRSEQFERLCSFVVTLAEDLFKAGRLGTVALNAEPSQPVRRLRDLEAFFDRVAVLSPTAAPPPLGAAGGTASAGRIRPRRNLLTFAPHGTGGVTAYVDGQPAATA